jgi:hypothetical protein
MTTAACHTGAVSRQAPLVNPLLVVPVAEGSSDWLELMQRHADNVTVAVLDGTTNPDLIDLSASDCVLVDGRSWDDQTIMDHALALLMRATAYQYPSPITAVTSCEAQLREQRYLRHWYIECIPSDRYTQRRIARFLRNVVPLSCR